MHRYNHNLETARSFFPEIVSTHTWEERWQTCQLVKAAGMELCCGVLLGMGESDGQRLELLEELRRLEPCEVPINFLNPRPGTPLAERPLVPAREALRWIALFRLGLPATILRYAGGREITLGELQETGMRAGVNALIIGNYLTTLGRSPALDVSLGPCRALEEAQKHQAQGSDNAIHRPHLERPNGPGPTSRTQRPRGAHSIRRVS